MLSTANISLERKKVPYRYGYKPLKKITISSSSRTIEEVSNAYVKLQVTFTDQQQRDRKDLLY